MKIAKAIEEYNLVIETVEGKAKRTVERYSIVLKQYQDYLSSECFENIEDVVFEDISHFIGKMEENHTASTCAEIASVLRGFHQYLNVTYNFKDPTINLTVKAKGLRLPVYLNEEELSELMATFGDGEQDIFARAVLELIYSCGLRVSEASECMISQVDFDAYYIRVTGKRDKTRIIPIPKASMEMLNRYLDTVRPVWNKKNLNYLFINRLGRKCTREYIENMLKLALEKTGIKKKITPHKLRHSYATHLLDHGANLRNVQELLGHENIKTTQIYTHVQKNKLIEDYNKFFPNAKGDKK